MLLTAGGIFEDDSVSAIEPFSKGLFEELDCSILEISNETGMSTNHIQEAWQGPPQQTAGFYFPPLIWK